MSPYVGGVNLSDPASGGGAAPAAGSLTGARARRLFRQPEAHGAGRGPAEKPAPVDLALHDGRYDARPGWTRAMIFRGLDAGEGGSVKYCFTSRRRFQG